MQEVRPEKVRLKILDETVTPLTAKETAALILQHVERREGITIANLNLHAAYLLHKDSQFASFTREAQICLCDGMPIVKMIKDPRFRSGNYRVGSTDWLDELITIDQGKVNFLSIAGTEQSARRAKENIHNRNPLINWVSFDGFNSTSPASNPLLASALETADVVLVGMGMPRQEKWIDENRSFLEGKVIANVGGCMDYYAGEQKLAPRWLGSLGLEWAYRLIKSPRRLAKRYLIEPFTLGYVLFARRLKKND